VWASIEVASVCLRHVREGNLSEQQGLELMDLFRTHCEAGIWGLIPISDSLLRRTASLIRAIPPRTDLRAGDAIHLATALEQGESAIWTNDRHLLAAAACVGLQGRSAD
jgi:predicted nucleic acid-binding protein